MFIQQNNGALWGLGAPNSSRLCGHPSFLRTLVCGNDMQTPSLKTSTTRADKETSSRSIKSGFLDHPECSFELNPFENICGWTASDVHKSRQSEPADGLCEASPSHGAAFPPASWKNGEAGGPSCSLLPLAVIKTISAELQEFQHEAETFVSFSHLWKQEEKSAVIFSQCSNYSKQNQSLDFLKAPQGANYFMFKQIFHSSFRFYRFHYIYSRKAPTLESVLNNDSASLSPARLTQSWGKRRRELCVTWKQGVTVTRYKRWVATLPLGSWSNSQRVKLSTNRSSSRSPEGSTEHLNNSRGGGD